MKLGNFLIRPDTKKWDHRREVTNWEEYLGGIAGLYELIMVTLTFIFGQYIYF